PYSSAYHMMQQELVEILQQQICWHDKAQAAYALNCVRRDYEYLEQERRMHLSKDCCEETEPVQTRRTPND
ncbi:hypothetical protein LCGC14_2695050, partial [marine sediment metagenome]